MRNINILIKRLTFIERNTKFLFTLSLDSKFPMATNGLRRARNTPAFITLFLNLGGLMLGTFSFGISICLTFIFGISIFGILNFGIFISGSLWVGLGFV